MYDSYSRNIEYMRVSITDRCNLRCGYCVPDGFMHVSHDDILRYEEILKLCKIIASIGVKAIRVTGGEPLVRKGCVDFIKRLKAIDGIEQVSLTTNGILLKPYIDRLKEAGLDGLNISLDTLYESTYKKITGKDKLGAVLSSIEMALKAGHKIKINTVLMRNINEKDMLTMAKMAQSKPIDIRFIELMPTNPKEKLRGISGAKALSVLRKTYPDLEQDFSKHGWGPAKYYKSSRLKGRIGFINAMSEHICSKCNRLRLTSQGLLVSCLYFDSAVDLRKMLKNGAEEKEIKNAVAEAVRSKPKRHAFDFENGAVKSMSNIGG